VCGWRGCTSPQPAGVCPAPAGGHHKECPAAEGEHTGRPFMPQAGSFSRPNERYTDRAHAGQVLASKITALQLADPVVLGLARGGVPVAGQVAGAVRAPLQVCVAGKIGAPGQPELALGAVTADGPPTYDDALVRSFGVRPHDLQQACERERAEARRREQLYQPSQVVSVAGIVAVLVDVGLSTGATARAAFCSQRQPYSLHVVLTVMLWAADTSRTLILRPGN